MISAKFNTVCSAKVSWLNRAGFAPGSQFGIPARTIEGWEQGRRIDVAHRVLLTIIARSPDLVEAALAQSD
jgi:hypothetical protein